MTRAVSIEGPSEEDYAVNVTQNLLGLVGPQAGIRLDQPFIAMQPKWLLPV